MGSRAWIGLSCIALLACAPHLPGVTSEIDDDLAIETRIDREAPDDDDEDEDESDDDDRLAIPSERCRRDQAAASSREVDPDEVGAALLTTRGAMVVGLPLVETDFHTNVTGTIAETTVTQTFVNDFTTPIEAVYTFPLPHDGAVDDYAFRFDGREVRAVMKKRADALADYDAAKREGKTAALLEQERPNIFTQSLANLPPGATIEVEIHVVQPLVPAQGRYELVLPTVVGPRHVPGTPTGHTGTGMVADTDRVADGSRITPPVLPPGMRTCGDLHITVAFDAGLPIRGIRSEAHRIRVGDDAAGRFVALDEDYALLDRDFVLSWRRAGDRPQAMMLTDEVDGERFFSLTIEPPREVPEADAPAREIVFVLDTSGSMNGKPLADAKAAMVQFLQGLRPGDAFQVVRFSDTASSLGDELVPATAPNVEKALEYVDGLDGGGGTTMTAGIQSALRFAHDPDRVRFVIFLTDGFIGNEAEIFALVEDSIGDARLFSIGVGSSVNRFLLDGMARVGRGDVEYVNLDEDAAPIVDRLYARLDRPALTDVHVDFGRTAVADLVPARVPDLLLDRPVVVFGRLRGPLRGDVVVRARRGGTPVELRVPVHAIEARSVRGIPSVWARERIEELLLEPAFLRGRGRAAQRIEATVVDLSLAHRVLTEYTAFIAVDSKPTIDGWHGSTTVVQGVELAEGMAHEQVWGHVAVPADGRDALGGSGSGSGSGYGYGSGHGSFHSRSRRVPHVRTARASVLGSIDKHIIRRIVRAHLGEIRGCYNAALVRDPKARGRIVVQFVISAIGTVTGAAIHESEIDDAALGKCIARKVKGWRFPVSDGAGAAIVNYPFVLAPAEPKN